MFEVPKADSLQDRIPCSVAVDLTTAACLTADIAQAFRMADVLFSEARLSHQRIYLTGTFAADGWPYWHRRIGEAARFRERTALIYLDTVLGYGISIQRLLSALHDRVEIPQNLVRRAMEEGASIAVAEEFVSESAFPDIDAGPCADHLRECQERARVSVGRALEAAHGEQVPSLHALLAEHCTDASESVVSCLSHVNRYVEALHFVLCQDLRPSSPLPSLQKSSL